jgi:hypothetical protein
MRAQDEAEERLHLLKRRGRHGPEVENPGKASCLRLYRIIVMNLSNLPY